MLNMRMMQAIQFFSPFQLSAQSVSDGSSNPIATRLNGLDTLRTCAILLVLMYHFKVVVSGKDTFGFISQIGWAGVDLFFVLSGYLIANQIFTSLRRGDFH